jgi:phospholipid/cholesterol/gamma-HCH transport system substrate-binding protein
VPSQQQLKWSQLRVGLTVLFAAVVLAVLIFLMTGSVGFLTRKITLKAYFDNASGLRVGAPVRLQGVDVGNVKMVQVSPNHGLTPVLVTMKVTTKYQGGIRKDSAAMLSTAGVLGEVFVDIDSVNAKGAPVQNGDELPIRERPDLSDMVRASQSTLQNIQALLKRVEGIVAQVESGQGSIGKLIYDPELFNRLNTTLIEFQKVATAVTDGKGSLGRFIVNDEFYRKTNATLNSVNSIIDQINRGQGTLGRVLKDPALYNNANETIAKANHLMDDVNAGKGTLGLIAKDQAFAQKVNATVVKLNEVANRLNAGEGSAGMFLRDPALYNNSNQMLTEARDLVTAIRQNPKKYLVIHLKIF